MFDPKTILAATDLTRRSRAVAKRAALLARLHGSRLVLVHTIEPRKQTVARISLRKFTDPNRKAEAQLQTICAAYPDLDISYRILTGPPATLVPDLAEEIGSDLIVLGLHLPRRVLETLRLTNLERITQAARCPVLIAHRDEMTPYCRVLGAITFAPASAQALRVAARLAPEAEMHAIHAIDKPMPARLPVDELMSTSEMTEAETLRDAFMARGDLPPCLHMPEIVPGGVHEVLQFRMAELQPDLVVIGSHSGRDTENLGNYARDLMRAPPTDMLIAKPE